MRVAIDARKLSDGESGIGGYTRNLVGGLLEADENLELLLVRHGRRRRERFESPRVEEVFVPFPPDSLLTPLALRHFLSPHRFDVFHSPFDLTPRGLDQPIVVSIHDINWIVNPAYVSYNPVVRLAGGLFFRSGLVSSMNAARRIIAVSHATRDAIVAFAPWHEPKLRVVHNGFDGKRIFPLPEDAARRAISHITNGANPFVLTVGR